MNHNVTITKEENKVIEEYWVMKEKNNYTYITCRPPKTQKLDHEPTLQEIAQFLSETQADFVSVEHNYRFADLPFC